MPSSNPDLVGPVMRLVMQLAPQSVLDLGVGFGKYGFLCREYLETNTNSVFRKADWKAHIDGVDVFTPYLQDHQRAVYNHLMPFDLDAEDIQNWIRRTKYNLYLAVDVLEHLNNWRELLEAIPDTGAIIAVTPLGLSPQGEVFGNCYEKHIQEFSALDLMPHFDSVKTVHGKLLCFRDARRTERTK